MTYEQTSGIDSDDVIRGYALAPLELQRDSWLHADFVCAFPDLVKRMLSPEGLNEHSTDTRMAFFQAALEALTTYQLKSRAPRASTSGEAAPEPSPLPGIAWHPFDYDVDTEQPKLRGGTREDQVCPLLEIDLAGVIALGMSLPDQRSAIVQLLKRSLTHRIKGACMTILVGCYQPTRMHGTGSRNITSMQSPA